MVTLGRVGCDRRRRRRNPQIERQVANELRHQGFGEQGQIMILAIGSKVISLGNVPDQDKKQQAEEMARDVSGVQDVQNTLGPAGFYPPLGYTPGEQDTQRDSTDQQTGTGQFGRQQSGSQQSGTNRQEDPNPDY